ncbi:MAG: NAD(P)/FAD-dependent oxidoreductase [Rhodospirillaceae bacterium]|nr:NAD(P)/FAD-dependent oxidoreductase [Rhodospirillaceae bacterium]
MTPAKTETLPCDILIVGAGIAGSALACALRDRGYSIVQTELSDRPLDTARGDHLQCVVVEILEQWGALSAFWEAGAEKRHGALYLSSRNELLLDAPHAGLPIPHPYYLYLNHELIGDTFLKLAATNPDHTLFRPARARDLETGPEGIKSLTLKLPEDAPAPEGYRPGQTVVIKPRMVVGADGRGSRVREALAFSAVEHDYENPLVILFGPRTEPDPLNRVTTFMGPQGNLSRIPRTGEHWKIGLPIRKGDIAFWKTATAKMRKGAITARAPQLDSLEAEVAGFYPVKLLNTHKWVHGNTVLLGDACHAMHPARGQGMNMAIRCVAKLVNLLPDVGEMVDAEIVARRLRAYESGVKPAVDKILAENHERGEEMDSLDPDIITRRMEALKVINGDAEMLRRYRLASAGYADALGAPTPI